MTKAEAKELIAALNRMFEAIPKSRRMEYLGELNDLSLVLERMQREATE